MDREIHNERLKFRATSRWPRQHDGGTLEENTQRCFVAAREFCTCQSGKDTKQSGLESPMAQM